MRFKEVEQWVRLLLSILIIALCVWLIVDDPKLSTQAQILLRILLAFGLAVLTASMAGLIEAEGGVVGWKIKAAGGFAVFIIVYFFTPAAFQALAPRHQASLTVGDIGQIDIRSIAERGTTDGDSGKAGVAVTIPLFASASSNFTPVDPALIRSARVSLQLPSLTAEAPWSYFVEMIQGKPGTWLSSGEPKLAGPFSVTVSTPENREVMFFVDANRISWSQVLDVLGQANSTIRIELNLETEEDLKVSSIRKQCSVSSEGFAQRIEAYRAAHSNIPLRITTACSKG